MSLIRLLVGLVGCLLLGLGGWALGCVTIDGVMALAVLGGLVFGTGGWTWGLLATAVLVVRLGMAWRGKVGHEPPRNGLAIAAVWGVPAIAALIYGAGQHTSAWAAFIGATAYAAADETLSSRTSLVSSLVVGALAGSAMLVVHDAAALRRGLPTGWIDLWLIPLGVVGALAGVPTRVWARRWGHLDLARLLGSVVAAVVTAVVGQAGWQLLGPILH
jgi:hypothetical protein